MGNVPRVGTQVKVSQYTRQTRETGADATKEQSALVTSSKPVRKACAIATNAKVEQDELHASRYRTHEKAKVAGQRNSRELQREPHAPAHKKTKASNATQLMG